jgi:glycosyltransferase involved in cell wall biosynthesis
LSHAPRVVVGLFPSTEVTGGVQTSGRLAWEAIGSLGSVRQPPVEPLLICYHPRRSPAEVPLIRHQGRTVHVRSKAAALLVAITASAPTRLTLVWHLGLLKLVPFMHQRGASIAVFLHGIEARRQGWLTRSLLARVALFLSNSDHTWQQFVSFNPQVRAWPHQTVHLGVGESIQGPLRLPPDPPRVLMLGRMASGEGYKGHQEMLDAWPQVLQRVPEAQLLIAGDGNLRPTLEHLVEQRDLRASVHFLGTVTEEQKQALLINSRCLALPSRGEGFGLVYVEAMRLGRPCLVSTADAGREVVNPPEAGLAVDADDHRAVSEALWQLMTPGAAWDQWSRQARQRYEREFTASHFQQRLLAALAPFIVGD